MSSSSSSQLTQPAKYGGWGQQKNSPQGGLQGKLFPTHNTLLPPAAKKGALIIAVVGTNLYEAGADKDGWFLSDFYLMHHLLRGRYEQQIWMTSCKPEDILGIPNQKPWYTHGDPRPDKRKIVLDHSMLHEVQDIRVIPQQHLKDQYVETVKKECRRCAKEGRPVHLLIFGHGSECTYWVSIGARSSEHSLLNRTYLKISDLKQAIGNHPDVSMYISACFSGGWVESQQLKASMWTTADADSVSLSWPESASQRHCGSPYATALVNVMTRMQIPELEDITVIREAPTYAAFTYFMNKVLETEINQARGQGVRFSAQDDKWDMGWEERTGLHLAELEVKYSELKADSATTLALHPGDVPVVATGGQRLPSQLSARLHLAELAQKYLNSNPGLGEMAGNQHTHSLCRRLLVGQDMTREELEIIYHTMQYRLDDIMGKATLYKNLVAPDYKDCEDIDVYDSIHKLEGTLVERHRQIRSRVLQDDTNLFSAPLHPLGGYPYAKGRHYVALMMTEEGWDNKRVDDALKIMKEVHCRRPFYDSVAK